MTVFYCIRLWQAPLAKQDKTIENKAAESSDSCWLFVISFIFCYNKLYAYIYKLKILTNTNRYV